MKESDCTRDIPREWFEICTAEGHPLVLKGLNFFLSESVALEEAQTVCAAYNGVVTVVKHTTRIRKIFRPVVTVESVDHVAS